MRTITANLALVAIGLVAFPADASAQSYGMFGPRSLGTWLQPPRNGQFSGGFQVAPGGAFLGGAPSVGSGSMFSSSWQRYAIPFTTSIASPSSPSGFTVLQSNQFPVGAPVEAPVGPGPAQLYAPAPQLYAPAMTPALPLPSQMEMEALPEAAAQAQLEAAAATQPAGQAPASNLPADQSGTTGNAAQPATSAAPVGGATSFLPPQKPALQFVTAPMVGTTEASGYLPRISEHLAQVARDHGIQLPEGVRVYVSNGTTVLRGVVLSPHDQVLLGNMAGLEPGIWRVSNQLTVAPGAAAPAGGSPAGTAARSAAPAR